MMKILILSIFFSNMIFMFTFHPLAMIFSLISQTILVALSMFLIMHFPWFSYTLILVFLGGMLILFTYMANIASNEKFFPNTKPLYIVPLIFLFALLLPKIEMKLNTDSKPINQETFNELMIMKPYEMNMLPLIIIMAALIILSLLAVVKISKMSSGALRTE
uniref:NADH dehydrogenase subunit 6 n=1 Tax=Glyptelasma gigas TaxID=2358227 RepID=UPI0021CC6FD1|nr:NADH dehydrogenase subunit 6 [Glyptelasma gigas]UWM12892.1 NADH dehydrogenase subunit 6 [Glyptelasma gigas]